MKTYHPVSAGFWTDEKTISMTPEQRYFMLYLLTNPHQRMLGIFSCPDKIMAFELGYDESAVKALKRLFQEMGIIKVSEKSGEIAVLNYLRYSIVKGGSPIMARLRNEIAETKDKELISFVFDHVSKYTDLVQTVQQLIHEAYECGIVERLECVKKEPAQIEQAKEPETNIYDTQSVIQKPAECQETQEFSLPYEIPIQERKVPQRPIKQGINTYGIDLEWIPKAVRGYKLAQSDYDAAKSRLDEGYTIDDLQIAFKAKKYEWERSYTMKRYITGKTIFGNPEKFPTYLEEGHRKHYKSYNEFEEITRGIQ